MNKHETHEHEQNGKYYHNGIMITSCMYLLL